MRNACPRKWPRLKRLGFTIVELLVVISIIAVLVSLLLPSVQQARESARRSVCANKMRQLAIALHNYESANGHFPAPGLACRNDDPNNNCGSFVPRCGKQLSWIVLTLPFMEEEALANQFDLKKTVFDQPNNPASTQPEILLCPSDGAEGKFCQSSITKDLPFGKGNYAGWASTVHVDLQSEFPGALGDWGMELRRVTDGLSKTFMLSEVRTRAEASDQRGAWAVPWNGSSLLAYDGHQVFDINREIDITVFMQRPNHEAPNLDPLYACEDPEAAQIAGMPCAEYKSCLGTRNPPPNSYLSSAPRSNHPGGVNVASMDGSVRFVTDAVDALSMSYRISVNEGLTTPMEQ